MLWEARIGLPIDTPTHQPSDLAIAQMPRKPVRSDGVATYEKLVSTIDTIFARDDSRTISLKELADAANVPVASVYHFFPVPEAALAALVEQYIEKAAVEIMSNLEPAEGSNWQGIVNEIFARGRVFNEKYPAAKKVRLCPHSSESARYLLLESNWTLAAAIASEFDRLFVLAPHLHIVDDLAMTIILTDALWSTSIALHGEITDQYAAEAERAVASFLFPVLGAELPEK